MINKFFWIGVSILLWISLIACNSQIESPPSISSMTPEPSATATRFPSIGILTPFPTYKAKQVTVNYVDTGDYSVFDMFFVQRFRDSKSRLVLYSDGQLILAGNPYQQKMLTTAEMKGFISQLDDLGFFSLYSNGRHDLTDMLYSFGSDYHPVDYDSSYCVLVNAEQRQTLCAYKPFLEDLVPEMKSTLQFLDKFHPEGLSVYHPDRLLLWVQRGRDAGNDELLQSAIPWSESLPSLEGSDRKLLYVEGEGAQKVYDFIGNTNIAKVFTQNNIEYTVRIQIVLPHEELVNWFQ